MKYVSIYLTKRVQNLNAEEYQMLAKAFTEDLKNWRGDSLWCLHVEMSLLPSGSVESVPLQYGWRHRRGTPSICMEGQSNSNIKTILSTNPKLAITLLIFKTHSKATAGIDKGLDAQTNQHHNEPRKRPPWVWPVWHFRMAQKWFNWERTVFSANGVEQLVIQMPKRWTST